MSEQRETTVTLRLSNAEAEDLRDWLNRTRQRGGVALFGDAALLAERLRNRLDCAMDLPVSPSSPVPGTPGEREEGAS